MHPVTRMRFAAANDDADEINPFESARRLQKVWAVVREIDRGMGAWLDGADAARMAETLATFTDEDWSTLEKAAGQKTLSATSRAMVIGEYRKRAAGLSRRPMK